MKKAGNPEGPAFEKYHVRRQATISNVLRIGSFGYKIYSDLDAVIWFCYLVEFASS
jgi:hypothetical protein